MMRQINNHVRLQMDHTRKGTTRAAISFGSSATKSLDWYPRHSEKRNDSNLQIWHITVCWEA